MSKSMGRRDSEGKRKTWTIEAGDWEKLYEALLKAKEKNNLLDVKLQRETDVIELERKHRDRALFNDIFEQKQLIFKYKCMENGLSPRKQKRKLMKRQTGVKTDSKQTLPDLKNSDTKEKAKPAKQTGLADMKEGRMKLLRKLTLPNLQASLAETPEDVPKEHQPTDSFMRLTLPALNSVSQKSVTSREEGKPRKLSMAYLYRSSTMPDLHNIVDTTDKEEQNDQTDEPDLGLWVGEPEFIGSVRRPRLKPQEMKDHTQPSGEARKLLIELTTPTGCSRNCGGSGVSFSGKEQLLPKVGDGSYTTRGVLTQQNIMSELQTMQLNNPLLIQLLSDRRK